MKVKLKRIEEYENINFSDETALLRNDINVIIEYYEKKLNKIEREIAKKEYYLIGQQTSPMFDFLLKKDISLRINRASIYEENYQDKAYASGNLNEFIMIAIRKRAVSDLNIEINKNNNLIISYNPTNLLINPRLKKKYKNEFDILLNEFKTEGNINKANKIINFFVEDFTFNANKINLKKYFDDEFWNSSETVNDFFALNKILEFKNRNIFYDFINNRTPFPFNNPEKLINVFDILALEKDFIIPPKKCLKKQYGNKND